MAGSQSLREKRASRDVIGSYVISATGWALLNHGLLNMSGSDMQTGSWTLTWTLYLQMGLGGVAFEGEQQ